MQPASSENPRFETIRHKKQIYDLKLTYKNGDKEINESDNDEL